MKNSRHPPANISTEDLKTWITLGNYVRPSMPADESLRLFSGKMRRLIHPRPEAPVIRAEGLRRASQAALNDLIVKPDCGILIREMQATFEDWLADAKPVNWQQLVVLPPCDRKPVVREWAVEHSHAILQAPEPEQIVDRSFVPVLPDAEGEGVVVIPQLEKWFLRHHEGLRLVRSLLQRLATLKRHCVVGCNSWAWGYLSRLIGADMIFPAGVTFPAFNANRLHRWMAAVAAPVESNQCFRLSKNGHDIFETGKDDSPVSDYFATLAARSLGIPWVAWHMWRREIRLGPDASDATQQKFPDEATLWITEPDEFVLPKGRVNPALLVLHALLIHDELAVKQLTSVLPGIDPIPILAALRSAELIDCEGELLRCTPAAYPTVRGHLVGAGFSGDEL